MKKFIYCTTIFLIAIIMMPGSIIAQSSDELVIYATPFTPENTLDAVISADQAGASPHKVYRLASTDTCYVFETAIAIDNDVTIIGDFGTDGRLPCIQPNVLSDGSVPGQLFVFTKSGSVVRLENLYLLGISVENSVNWGGGMGVTVNGDNIKTYINNVVFEQWSQFSINYSGEWNSFWVTNCKFRNSVNTGSVYTGEAFRMRNDLGTALTDTVVMRHNTYLAVNAYAMCTPVGGYMNYAEFSHNTIVSMVKNPFFGMNITNWKVEHNIFYGTYVAGMANGEFPYWDRVWTPGIGATIDLDTMNIQNAARAGIDTTQANWSELAEASRTIDLNDNVYFRPQSIIDYIAAWNDTATGLDSIHTTDWMNEITEGMFADDQSWPGLHADGNLVGTDPGYGEGIINMIGAPGTTVAEGNGIGLIPYIAAARGNGGVANDLYGYAMSVPDYSSGNWVPVWPLPEYASGDLKYSANLTATDGLPYGDQFWFTGEVVGVDDENGIAQLPNEFQLEQNYPNPFNPSTQIQFAVPQTSNVVLRIFDVLGSEVKTLVNETKPAGVYNILWNGDNRFNQKVSSGVYFYTLTSGNALITKKMILMK